MEKYSEIGYSVKPKSLTVDELEIEKMSTPDEIEDALLYHKLVGSAVLGKEKEDVEVTYKVGLYTNESNVYVKEDAQGKDFYINNDEKKVLANVLALHIKNFVCSDSKKEFPDNALSPIICDFEGLILALEQCGYDFGNLSFDAIEEFVTSADLCLIDVAHNDGLVRLRRKLK